MFDIQKYYSDPEGRYIIVDIKTEDQIITLLNLYAPNNDEPSFFQNIFNNNLSTFECDYLVIGGDFNLVQNLEKDKKGGNQTTHFKSLKEIENLKESMDLTDIWRDLHPDSQRFTWRRNPEVHCRLDFFLISSSLATNALEADILPGFRTDHSLITLCIGTKTNPRGPGFWKLNTHFLRDLEYISLIKNTINEVSNDYKDDETVDPVLLWDVLKMQIRASSIKYAKEYKAKQRQSKTTYPMLRRMKLVKSCWLKNKTLSN